MATAAALYTPAVLALATGLAAVPLDDGLDRRGSARSVSCGSSLTIGLALDGAGRIARVGVSASACAVGQAAAMIFAAGAVGRTRSEIARADAAMAAWLEGHLAASVADGGGEAVALPDWPGLAAIAAAAHFPGRHGAIGLAWRAALAALAAGEDGATPDALSSGTAAS